MKALLKRLANKLPWWVNWLLASLPLTQILDPRLIGEYLTGWGVPAAIVALVVSKLTGVFRDAPVEECKKVKCKK